METDTRRELRLTLSCGQSSSMGGHPGDISRAAIYCAGLKMTALMFGGAFRQFGRTQSSVAPLPPPHELLRYISDSQ